MSKQKTYYRNLIEIEHCEPESLWVLVTPGVIDLVNEDGFVRVHMDEHPGVFYPLPESFKFPVRK